MQDKLSENDKANIEQRINYLKERQFDSQREKYENMIDVMQK